ncbi:transmembrane protein 209-like [Culicoides brevitarsis]|uniref:transmembrane protein 209-like n=1 Tax=Culicoides brevitarsis TaxID=469753 RepID=UPI00307CBB79
MDKSLTSPNRSLLNQSLQLQVTNKHRRNCLTYGALNALFLAILWFDISQQCPYSVSYWYYVEYVAAGILGVSLLYNILSYVYHRFLVSPLVVTEEQRKLLRLDDVDGSFVVSPAKSQKLNTTMDKAAAANMNVSSLSWQSYNEGNTGISSASWAFNKTSQSFDSPSFNLMNVSADMSFNQSMPNNVSGIAHRNYNNKSEIITDTKRIKQYLKETNEAEAKNANILPDNNLTQTNESFTSFWNNCRFDDLSALLKTSLYQLSPSTNSASSPSSKQNPLKDETGLGKILDGNSEVLKKIPSEKLSAYVANLRIWIADTILHRLVKEFDYINEKLKTRGFSDIQVGAVGLERLKKTAENHQLVALYVPTLPMIIPFLEMSTNQEYLCKRIRDLAHGKCISDYRWNSGAPYGGASWNDHLPTDTAILFHLICTYFDSQLMPLPNRDRPFYSQYVIEMDGNKKSQTEILSEVKNKAKCAILCMNPMKPKINFISDDIIHTCAHDRNNLFYVIIQFLLFMKSRNDSLLEGVSLGRRGINIMCCVEEDTN